MTHFTTGIMVSLMKIKFHILEGKMFLNKNIIKQNVNDIASVVISKIISEQNKRILFII